LSKSQFPVIEQRHRITRRVTLIGALVNSLLATSQILAGVLGHSQALLADGIHTLSDLASDFIILVAVGKAAIDADDNHPYGHGRIETLASVLLGGLLLLVGLGIGYKGILSIFNPSDTNPEVITIGFALLAIICKEGLYHYTSIMARKIHSSLLESNAWHHRSDALSSLVVLIGISAQLLGLPHMDALAATVVALMIGFMGIKLALKAIDELIDTALEPELIEQITDHIVSTDGVKGLHSLRSRSMGGLGYVDAEILVDPRLTVSEAHYIAFDLELTIKSSFSSIVDIQIHVDPLKESDHEAVSNLPHRPEIVEELQRRLQTNPYFSHILNIRLHYLEDRIEVEIVLPVSLAATECRKDILNMVTKTQNTDYIGDVSVSFRLEA
jgi:cation diffusion facilitator family transporter